MDVQGSKKYSTTLCTTLNWAWYQYTYITSNIVSEESDLCCDNEIRFGQVISCRIHHTSGRGNLALSHCGGIEKEQEALNFHGFPKIEHCHKKGSLSFTFYGRSTKHGAKACILFISRWLFRLSSDNNRPRRHVQDYLCYQLGNICLDNHAFWIEECSTNLPTSSEYGISWIPWGVHEIVFGWIQCMQWL